MIVSAEYSTGVENAGAINLANPGMKKSHTSAKQHHALVKYDPVSKAHTTSKATILGT